MYPLERYLDRAPDLTYGNPQWIWEVQIIKVILTGPRPGEFNWTGAITTSDGCPVYVQDPSRETILEVLEASLLRFWPSFSQYLVPVEPRSALARVCDEEYLF